MELPESPVEREIANLQAAKTHPNVIRYLHHESVGFFTYIVLELCLTSLDKYISRVGDQLESIDALAPRCMLEEIASGLRHLHSLGVVHRDLKPQNILISMPTSEGRHRMVITDFGISRIIGPGEVGFDPTFTGNGTSGWRAPEILQSQKERAEADKLAILDKSVDVFAFGCITYYILTRGEHPFGNHYQRDGNILQGSAILDHLDNSYAEAVGLIRSAISREPGARYVPPFCRRSYNNCL